MIIAGWQDMLLSLTWNRSYDMDSSMLILYASLHSFIPSCLSLLAKATSPFERLR
jgi:hypothetical protein